MKVTEESQLRIDGRKTLTCALFHQQIITRVNMLENISRREFITGFTGSAGTAITKTEADFGQTEDTSSGRTAVGRIIWTFYRMKSVPTVLEFIADKLNENGTLGFDGRLVAVDEGKEYAKAASKKGGNVIMHMI